MTPTPAPEPSEASAISASRKVHWANHVRRHALQKPGEVALRYREESLTWGQLQQRIETTAAGLARAGVGPGDRVALLLTNVEEYVELVVAVMSVGAIAVPINFRLSGAEAAFILEDSASKLVFVEQDLEELAREALAALDLPMVCVVLGENPTAVAPSAIGYGAEFLAGVTTEATVGGGRANFHSAGTRRPLSLVLVHRSGGSGGPSSRISRTPSNSTPRA